MYLYLKHVWPRIQVYLRGGVREELRSERSFECGILCVYWTTESSPAVLYTLQFFHPPSRQKDHCLKPWPIVSFCSRLGTSTVMALHSRNHKIMLARWLPVRRHCDIPPGARNVSYSVLLCCVIAQRISRTWWPRGGVMVLQLRVHVFYCCNYNILLK